jgi:hypothetical protein
MWTTGNAKFKVLKIDESITVTGAILEQRFPLGDFPV